MSKQKDKELESILTEINSGIKKSKTDETKSEGSKKDDKAYEDKKPSFIEKAKIIEKEPESADILFDRKSKHIEVTESEKINSEDDKAEDAQENTRSKKISKSELKKKNGTAVARQSVKKTEKSPKQKRVAVFGVFITIFVIIGLFSTILSGAKLTGNLINNTSLKQELVTEIFPLVIVDVPEFENPAKLDNSAIIASSIWDFIIDEQDKSKYKKDDLGSIYVPDVDIEKHIRRIYGSNVKIVHQSVDDSSVQMTYNPESKYYVIESTPKFLPYTPRVDKVVKNKNIYTLRVSYILPNAMWNIKTDKKTETVDKVMEYKLKKNDDGFQMMSVKLIEVSHGDETAAGQNKDELAEEEFIEEEPASSQAPTEKKASEPEKKAETTKK